jgi:TolA-binding protein
MKNTVWTTQAVCLLGLLALSGCASTTSPPIAPTGPGASQDQATVQALQKRLQERERTIAKQNYRIDVLASQLDALKRIDQDTKAQQRPVRTLMNEAQ